MKHFLETSKNIQALSEGFFDLANDAAIDSQISKDVNNDFLSKCKGDYKILTLKDGSVKINGKLLINKYDKDTLEGLKCKDFKGKLIIENCPNLKTLKDSFLSGIVVFDGSITINQCPALESLEGIPNMVKGDVMITNCKKLKDFGTLESVFGNFYWERNGKKYTDEEIRNKVSVIKKVFCSEEEIEADVVEGLVNEAFNNPWLSKLASQLKKYPYKEYSWRDNAPTKVDTVDKFFRSYGMRSWRGGRLLDKVTNDDVDVYSSESKSDMTTLSKVFWNMYNARTLRADCILVFDEDRGEFVGAFAGTGGQRGVQGEGIKWVRLPNKDWHDRGMDDVFYTKTEARDKLLGYGAGYTFVVFKCEADSESNDEKRTDMQMARRNAQAGVIQPGDVEQYKTIAAENIKRYKEIVARNKASRKSDQYSALPDEVEKIMTRSFKLTRAVAKDPKNFSKWDVTAFLNWIREEKVYSRYSRNYSGEYGLMYYFKSFMDAYMSMFGNKSYGEPGEYEARALENTSNQLKQAINKADEKLKKFGF